MNVKDFAELIVNQINDKDDWFIQFTAKRAYNPRVVLSKVTALKVLVVPKDFETNREDETGWDQLIGVDIGIVKKLSQREVVTGLEDNPEIDPLMDLVAEVIAFFQSDEYEAPEGYDVDAIVNKPIYDVRHMAENRQFTSVITVRFNAVVQEVEA